MPARAYWKGYLRLSLVTIGIELFTAVNSGKDTALHQIHKPSGKRIRYEKVAPGIGAVKAKDIVKGFEVEKDEYVVLDPEELDEIKLESRRTIDLVQFVDHEEIDPRYYERPYYVTPAADEVAAEGFAVIREALRSGKKVGLGQMATRGRDQMCAVRACGDGLLLETLRYRNEQEVRGVPVDGITNVLSQVVSESAVTLLPDYFLKSSHPGVAFVPVSDPKARWDFIVLWQKGRASIPVRGLVDSLKTSSDSKTQPKR